jgi:hypothetical protein
MTVGTQVVAGENVYTGYWGDNDVLTRGALTDRDFSTGTNDYEISVLSQSKWSVQNVVGRSLWFSLGKDASSAVDAFTANELTSMTLHVGGRSFAFADATTFNNFDVGDIYSWPLSSSFGWANNDEVDVSITAVQVVTIEAVTSTVEYGGNNNAAESTAEFRFTRTGSTDDALSFEVAHTVPDSGQSPEVVTRKFAAGRSSLRNVHWAVDVDRSNNPGCSFFWTVQSGTGYAVGTPNTAQVNVEGPGTTCMSGI